MIVSTPNVLSLHFIVHILSDKVNLVEYFGIGTEVFLKDFRELNS